MMRNKNTFRSLLGAMAALWGVGLSAPAQAQTAPTNAQLLDRALATVKPGDKYVRIGDMLLSVDKLRAYRGQMGSGRTASSAFYQTNFWPEGKVPYVIDQTLLPAQRSIFIEAIRELETVAQLKFFPRTTETDYIRVFTDPTAIGFSYSLIGRNGGEQPLSLGAGGNRYVAVHEMMHALGVMHEQIRSDRDAFVTIDFSNITTDAQSQFAIVNNSNNRSAYDFDSVMHYGQNFFAVDRSKPNIIVKPQFQRFQTRIGQQSFISDGDKKGLVDIYGPAGDIARPSNDFFAQAQNIEGSQGSVTGSNLFATAENGEDERTGRDAQSSIWYRWRPANNGTVTITTKGSSIDTTLGVYLGISVSTVTTVTFNDDEFPGATTPEEGLTSSVTFPAQANAVYYIAVDSATDFFKAGGQTGPITLNWNQKVDATRYKISGVVKTSTGQNLSGVSITLTGADANNSTTTATTTSNGSGEYSFSNLLAGNYNLRASKAGFTFSPNPLKLKVSANTTGNNFTATLIPASLLPEMFVSDVTIREGNANESFVTFTVSISSPSKEPVTVAYATANGSALSTSDYNGIKGSLTFAPGLTTIGVNVRIRPDSAVEPDENFALKISNAAGAKIVDDTGVATLVNDD